MKHSHTIPNQLTEIVSRETIEKLDLYQNLLLKWQKKINLISANTIDDAWDRHFIDSIQVYPLLPSQMESVVDLGSGAGFPGLVLAMMGAQHITLIESDRRKCIFLREVARALELSNIEIINKRIEAVTDIKADVVTARALASLDQLMDWARLFAKPETVLIFPKGESYQTEIDNVALPETAVIETHDSVTSADAKIIKLSGFFLE